MEAVKARGIGSVLPPSPSTQQTFTSRAIRSKSASLRPDFPDPRLFDFDRNGRVDANDVIQERNARQELRSEQSGSIASQVERSVNVGEKEEERQGVSIVA